MPTSRQPIQREALIQRLWQYLSENCPQSTPHPPDNPHPVPRLIDRQAAPRAEFCCRSIAVGLEVSLGSSCRMTGPEASRFSINLPFR
jgi:hypothetical protein